jgi:hypothetical protein
METTILAAAVQQPILEHLVAEESEALVEVETVPLPIQMEVAPLEQLTQVVVEEALLVLRGGLVDLES